MDALSTWLDERPAVRNILIPALAVLFGIEMIRYFVSGMTWILGDRFAVGAFQLGGVAIVFFGLAFLAALLGRLLGSRRSLIVTAVGLGVMRLLAQMPYGEPLTNLAITALGVGFFGMFLTIWLESTRSVGRQALAHLAVGLLLGFILDTALNGLFGTYDYIYQGGIIPIIVAVLAVFVWFIVLWGYSPAANGEPANAGAWPWLSIGFFFFLELVVLGNIARLAAITGWILPAAFLAVLLGQIGGLFLAVWLFSLEKVMPRTTVLLACLLLIVSTIFAGSGSALVAALMTVTGQLSLGLLLACIVSSLGTHTNGRAYDKSTASNGFAMLTLAVLVLAYYAVYQISLPYSNTYLEIAAAILLVVCVAASLRSYNTMPKLRASLYMAPVISLVLMAAPLVGFVAWQDTQASDTGNGNITIMSYNLHNGFDTDGNLGLEALAAVIEENGADIVALQEISRGWLISGGVDMLSWLSQRLDMPYVSGPTAGPLWGNAILSKYEITGYTNYSLPPDDLYIERGFLAASIDTGDTELQIIATHLHHIEEDSAIRQTQVPVILDYWDGAPNPILLGDFNAWTDSAEMELLYQAGLADTLADQPEVLTFSSADLYERIDYIWLSPDIGLVESYVPFSQASDHLAVVAVIER